MSLNYEFPTGNTTDSTFTSDFGFDYSNSSNIIAGISENKEKISERNNNIKNTHAEFKESKGKFYGGVISVGIMSFLFILFILLAIFTKGETGAIIFLSVFEIGWLILFIYFLIHYLKPRLLIIINAEGIWTRKLGWTEWKNISYIYTETSIFGSARRRRYSRTTLFFMKTINREKEINVYLGATEYNEPWTIRNAIEFYRGTHVIIDQGDKKPPKKWISLKS